MTRSDFDAFVQRQQKIKEEENAFDPTEQLQEWLDYLDFLYKKIVGYLKIYSETGAAQIEYQEIQCNEEFIGTYTARKMALKIGLSTITFTPIGTMLIGSKGRVDVQGPLGKARLVLINKNVTAARQLVQTAIVAPGQSSPASPSGQAIKKNEWDWKIATQPPNLKFFDLTQEAFFDMILAVANG